MNPSLALVWRKSSRCESNWCLEVAQAGRMVLVRDSKNPQGPALRLSDVAWTAFVADVKAGTFGL